MLFKSIWIFLNWRLEDSLFSHPPHHKSPSVAPEELLTQSQVPPLVTSRLGCSWEQGEREGAGWDFFVSYMAQAGGSDTLENQLKKVGLVRQRLIIDY